MKFRSLIYALIALSFLAPLFAETTRFSGAVQYGETTLDALDGAGLVKLNGTTVASIHLSGSLIAQNADIGSLDILGEANLKDTTIALPSTIMGSLQATRTTFKNPLTILSQKALFTASSLDAITIKKDGGYKGKQIVELKQGTQINGPIHFEAGNGEVIVFPGCQVFGPVTGGKVIKKS